MDKVEAVDRFLKAYVAGDVEQAIEMLDPDVVVVEADGLPYGGVYKGREGFLELLDRFAGLGLGMEVLPYTLHDAGEFVVARGGVAFTSLASGDVLEMAVTELYWVTPEGRFSRIEPFYRDTKAVHTLHADGHQSAGVSRTS